MKSLWNNFKVAFALSLIHIFYAAFRYFGIFSERSVKDVLGWLVKFIGYYAVALMIAAVIFLPVIMTIFGTDRFHCLLYTS